LARLVDSLYGFVVGFVAGLIAGIALAVLEDLSIAAPGVANRIGRVNMALVIAGLIGSLFYETICEGLYGATLGKLICGLRVVSEDLTPCRLKPALLRSSAYYLDAIAFGAVGYLEMRKTLMQQRHGDRWAKTVVVKTSQVPESSKRSGLRFLVAFVLGSAAGVLPATAAVVWSGLR
jgi:uncharacterized RDD family membrane protein YckC